MWRNQRGAHFLSAFPGCPNSRAGRTLLALSRTCRAPRQIAGILVLNAHRASDASGEGFAVRLFRGANAAGFVRGLTDAPTALAAGFAKVERVLKALYVRRLHLWPRFAAQVRETLDDLGTSVRLRPRQAPLHKESRGLFHNQARRRGLLTRCVRASAAAGVAACACACARRWPLRFALTAGMHARRAQQEVGSAGLQAVPKQPQAASTSLPRALAHAISCTWSESHHRLR